jgi:hypothetical protein
MLKRTVNTHAHTNARARVIIVRVAKASGRERPRFTYPEIAGECDRTASQSVGPVLSLDVWDVRSGGADLTDEFTDELFDRRRVTRRQRIPERVDQRLGCCVTVRGTLQQQSERASTVDTNRSRPCSRQYATL